jgi:hypothetical protein
MLKSWVRPEIEMRGQTREFNISQNVEKLDLTPRTSTSAPPKMLKSWVRPGNSTFPRNVEKLDRPPRTSTSAPPKMLKSWVRPEIEMRGQTLEFNISRNVEKLDLTRGIRASG